jgi:Uma2 family endonuclease
MVAAAPREDRFSVRVSYRVPRVSEGWTITEEPVPESQTHDIVLDMLKAILLAWTARRGGNAQVARNLAVRWDPEHPNIGANPDLCVIEPRTPEGDELSSLCLWKPGHTAPVLVVEVVSESRPAKDYTTAPERYAACGAGELWVFDPLMVGPAAHGGPVRLQVWARDVSGGFERQYAGDGPAWSPLLGAWLLAVAEGQRLRIAGDPTAEDMWLTGEERERAEKERERAEKERALAKLVELEVKLRG